MKLLQLENKSVPQKISFSNTKVSQTTKKIQLKKHAYHKSFYDFARNTSINLSGDDKLNNKMNEFKSKLASFLTNKDTSIKSAKCTCADLFTNNQPKWSSHIKHKRSSLQQLSGSQHNDLAKKKKNIKQYMAALSE